ncbi:LORF2 protein, partial [Crocuta crocuta]
IRELKIKTTRYHCTSIRITKPQTLATSNPDKDLKQQGLLVIVGRTAIWKTDLQFLTELNTRFPYNPAITFLGIYPKELKTYEHMYMFIAALSTIAKTWKEPKCPSMDEWIKKMWFIYTMEYYMAMRKNEIWPCVATWMDLEGVMLSEISQTEKDKYHMFAHIGGL